MRGNIGVRVNDGVNDRVVTGRTTGLKFSKQSDGGHKAASFTLTVPRGTFADLGPSDRCYLYDTRHGGTVWEGYTDAPTPASGPNGERYEVSALGGMIRAADETRSLLYVSRTTSDFGKHVAALQSSTAEQVAGSVTTTPFMRVQFANGTLVNTSDTAWIVNDAMGNCDMPLGGVRVSTASGKNDSGYRVEFATSLPQAVPIGFSGTAMSTTGVQQSLFIGSDFSAARGFGFRLIRTGFAVNIADENTWSLFAGVSFIGQRVNRTGTALTGSSGLTTAAYVEADWVVEDLLGRLLTFCDPAASSIDSSAAVQIDQLAYADGATAQRVLDDLADFEPGFLWEILHSTSSGKHIFNYRAWPTIARYEVTTRDGYAESGSDTDLCNRILVTWTDASGTTQTTPVTATSAQYPALKALEDAGRVRDADPVSLPDGLGSLANALALGAAILADSAGQPVSARATIRRPIRDLYTGAMVMPWEIEPGYLVTVRETGALHRLTLMEYDDDSASTALTLGYPSPTREQRIAQLAR